jgi:uncharacterized iron-regulated protein
VPIARTIIGVLVLLAVPPASACSYRAPDNDQIFWKVSANWRASTSHPLAGMAYNTSEKGREDEKRFAIMCGGSTFYRIARNLSGILLLGEIHDNREHHKVQALLTGMHEPSTGPSKTAVVFEQFRADQQGVLEAFTSNPFSVDELKRTTNWSKSGWGDTMYDRLFQEVVNFRLPLYAGDLPRASIMKVAKDGEGALPAEDRARLKLDLPLGAKLDDASLTEIEESHCGMMPKEALGGMAFAQRYRDASLADAVLKAADRHGSAILIAGNGHVRTDRGVPWYIRQRAPDKKVVAVMLIEVEDGKNDPEAYVPRDPDGKPAADYIIFTPRAERGDPCEKMRAKSGK